MDFQKLNDFIDSLDIKSLNYVKEKIKEKTEKLKIVKFSEHKKLKMYETEIVKKYEILTKSIENMEVKENKYKRLDYHVHSSITFKIDWHLFSIIFNGTNEGFGDLSIFWNDNCILECGNYDFKNEDLDEENFDEQFYQSQFKEIDKKDFIEFLRELSV